MESFTKITDRVQAREAPHSVLPDGAQEEPAKLRQRPAGLDSDALTVGELDRRVARLATQLVRLRRCVNEEDGVFCMTSSKCRV